MVRLVVSAMGALVAVACRQPASLLAHTVHWWSVENLFQRAVFLSEVALVCLCVFRKNTEGVCAIARAHACSCFLALVASCVVAGVQQDSSSGRTLPARHASQRARGQKTAGGGKV